MQLNFMWLTFTLIIINTVTNSLPEISKYFVIYFCWLLIQRICRGKDSYSCQILTGRMQITSTFQYARNQIATSFNVRNIFLHATLDNFPKCFRWCWHPATMQAKYTWNTLFIFPLTRVQRMVHGSVIILKEQRLTTKCLDTTGQVSQTLTLWFIKQHYYFLGPIAQSRRPGN